MEKTFKMNRGQYELQLLIASRQVSDLAIQLAKQADEEVGLLPTKEQFDRAYKVVQTQTDWLEENLFATLERIGLVTEEPED